MALGGASRVVYTLAAAVRAAARAVMPGSICSSPMKPKSTLRKAVITLPPVRHCVASGNCGSPAAVAKRHFSLSSMSLATSDEPYHSPKPKSRNMIGAIVPSSAARARPMRMPCLHAASRLAPKLSMT